MIKTMRCFSWRGGNVGSVLACCRPYRCQLVKACKELIEGHDQLLRRALGRQTGETLDVGEQDAGDTETRKHN